MRILLVEDEAGMVDALTAALRRHGIALDHAGTLAAARSLADSGQHDAVLLDRRLPDGDGLELLVRLRARQEGVPVIVMTAVGELADKVGGLNAGADDYLVKPFAFDELLARLRAVLRRPVLMQPDVVRLGTGVRPDTQRGQRRGPAAGTAAPRIAGAGNPGPAGRHRGARRARERGVQPG